MKQIADFFTLYKKYVWEKNSKGLISLYDNQILVFDMWHDAYCEGLTKWSGIIEQWLGSLNEERVNVIFEMISISANENIGFASAMVGYEAVSSDQKIVRSMRNRITTGFIKTTSGWKVNHQHTSSPIDDTLQAIL